MSNMAPVHYRLLLLEILVVFFASRLSQGELLQHYCLLPLQPRGLCGN